MKKLLVSVMIILLVSTSLMAAEKKPLKDVDSDEFTADTQVTLQGAGDDHAALAWWIPKEFWESVFSRDATTSESDKKAMIDVISDISLLVIVQADITSFGACNFYSKEEIEERMLISFVDTGGKKHRLSPMQTVGPNLEIVLGVFKPILGAAIGSFGNNMHFYVLDDKTESSSRLLDPYRKGYINIQLSQRNGTLMSGSIEMPLNSLFVPRECPNGKKAHVSWNYCPWTGKRLEE